MKKIFLTLFLLSINAGFCQNKENENFTSIALEVYSKSFKELSSPEETKNIISLQKIPFNCLYQCVAGVEYIKEDRDIQDAILRRAIEITTLLYQRGTPVYLISGMDSSYEANKNNQDLTDDNNLIYIGIAECISSNSLEKIKNVVNQKTLELINKK